MINRSALRLAIVPAALALTLYALTIAPEIGSGDSAELSLQAWQLGATHPPGYPVLYKCQC